MPTNASLIKYPLQPISSSLKITSLGDLVWIVEYTLWPVIAALTAILAVISSLISPTIITSGSCLRMLLKPDSKVIPIFSFKFIWFNPSIATSIGSSKVSMFIFSFFILFKIEYKVVDLPLPVGPLTITRPFFNFTILFIMFCCFFEKFNFSKEDKYLSL